MVKKIDLAFADEKKAANIDRLKALEKSGPEM